MIKLALQLACTLGSATAIAWAFGAIALLVISGALFVVAAVVLLARDIYDAGGHALPFSRFLECLGLAALIAMWPIAPAVFGWAERKTVAHHEGDA